MPAPTQTDSETARAQEAPGPVTANERVHAADVLRGIAILGILLVNMRLFNHPIQLEVLGEAVWDRPGDRFVTGLVQFFAEGKFYVLFSFLFGWGFSVLLERAEAKGARAVRLYRRRIAILLGIGALHVLLLWFGDILFAYAVLGFTLPWFRTRSDASLRRWVVALILTPLLLQGVLLAGEQAGRMSPEAAEQIDAQQAEQEAWFRDAGQEALRVYPEGTFGEIVGRRLADYGFMFFGWFLLAGGGFQILAMFLVGLYAGRHRWLHEARARPELWRRVLVWALPIGLVGNLVYVWGMAEPAGLGASLRAYLAIVGIMLGGPALSAAYVAAVLLWMRRAQVRERLVAIFAPVGRMALTNYLLQSIVCTTIFYSYGFGLYGRVSPAAGLGLTFAIYGAQIVLSRLWLERYRFGPAEWAWRALTYGTRPPMRRAATGAD
jgi:uncharacterized protein